MDSPGCTGVCSECCMAQVTTCVKPRPKFLTSTCCPRWTIGCSTGSVGCCDPARPWQEEGDQSHNGLSSKLISAGIARSPTRWQSKDLKLQTPAEEPPLLATAAVGKGNATGFGCFTRSLLPGLACLTFDAGSGHVTARHPVSGPFAEYLKLYVGEGTRLFPWDPVSGRFYFADTLFNKSAPGSYGDNPLVLYTLNPADGSTTASAVSGGGCPAGFPMGMGWDAVHKSLVLTFQSASEVSFCSVDPVTATSTALGTLSRGATEETSGAYYAAYLSHVHGGEAVRVGHKLVTTGKEAGVGVVSLGDLRSSAAHVEVQGPTLSWSGLPLASHAIPSSVRKHPKSGYVSLAQRTGGSSDGKPGLDIIGWDVSGTSEKVLAALANAHSPRIPFLNTPLGYITDALDGTLYGAMTVALHPAPLGVMNKWSVSTLNLNTGALVEAELKPQPGLIGAGEVSLSGFGLIAPKMA